MANLENNHDNEHKKSIQRKVESSVQKGVENVQETLKEGADLAKDAVQHPVETAQEFGKVAAQNVTSYRWWAKLLLILFWTGLLLAVSLLIIINLPATKNYAAKRVVEMLNRDLKSQISFDKVDVDFFGDIYIHNVSIKDQRNFPFIKAKKLYADSNWFSILSNSRNLQFQSLSLDSMDAKVITYKGDSIANFVRFVNLFDSGPKNPKKDPFQLKSRIYITNSKVSIINENHEGSGGVWLNAKNLNLNVPELKVNGPNISAQINNLRFTTSRWGKSHYVETFSGDLAYTKEFLSLKDLTFNTDHSLLQGNIKFTLHNGSWSDFNNRVRIDMDLKQGSQISGYDLSYFVTTWDNYKPFNISGGFSGQINNFYLSNFYIHNQDVHIRTNTLAAHRITDSKNFKIETRYLSTDFTYKNLREMMPAFIAKKLKTLADPFGRMRYTGSASVTPQEVYVPGGTLVSDIGFAKINNFRLRDYSGPLPKFTGYAELRDFNSAAITKSPQVGLITGKFNVDGQSFDVNTMRLRTKSQIEKIIITGRQINNIVLDGILDHKKYFGIINADDQHAAGTVKGLIDFSTKNLKADITADIKKFSLGFFTGSKQNTLLSGFVKAKLSMTTLDDLNLDADISTLTFNNGSTAYTIPQSKIKTFFEGGNRIITVDAPDAVTGKLAGKFELSELAGMLQNGVGRILVGPPPRKLYRGKNVNFDFDVKQKLVDYFEPNLKMYRGLAVHGSYDGSSNNLVLNADAPGLLYLMTKTEEITEADKALERANPAYRAAPRKTADSATAQNLIVRINTANLNEQIYIKADRARYSDNVFKNFTLSGHNEGGKILHIATNFKLGSPQEEIDGELKDYAVNINQTADAAGDYVFRFEPTTIKYRDVAWTIDTDPALNHSITYRKKSGDFLIQNFRITSDASELFVKNAVFKSAKEFQADAEVKNLDIAKILMMQSGGNTMDIQGIANGTLKIKMDKSNLQPIIDINVNGIKMNGKEMGNVVVNAKNSGTPNVFDVSAKVVDSQIFGQNSLDLSGTVNNNTSSPTLDISVDMKNFDLAFTNEFVKGVFGNVRGKANGILKISGPLNDINYNGDIALHGFGLKLNFTGVDYSMEDTTVNLSKGLAILNNIAIKDGRANSGGSISGAIQFQTLSSMGVNLVLRADNLLVLNTTQNDSDLFWGRVYGNGTLYVDGAVSSLNISTPDMRALNNSTFTFNSGSASSVDEFKMLRFLKEDKTGAISVEEKKKTGSNINVDFTLAVDKGTTVNVLIGGDVGDISVRGASERLRFRMPRQGAIQMDGTYTVESGTFVSKAILERTFQIARGSSIKWDGDAVAPALDITANYTRTVSNAGEYLNMGTLPPLKVLLQTKITGTLQKPVPELDVLVPDVSSQIRETLANKMDNEDEKVVQFGSILVMNNFNVANSGGLDINSANLIASSGYNLLFKQLSSVLNTISNELQVDLNYIKGDQASNTGDRANTSVSLTLSPRVTMKTGLGIPLSKNESTNYNYLSGEGTIEYDFSKNNDGTKVLQVYSKPSNLGLTPGVAGNPGANQTYGGGVVWSKSFNTIFKRKKKDAGMRGTNAATVKDSLKIKRESTRK